MVRGDDSVLRGHSRSCEDLAALPVGPGDADLPVDVEHRDGVIADLNEVGVVVALAAVQPDPTRPDRPTSKTARYLPWSLACSSKSITRWSWMKYF